MQLPLLAATPPLTIDVIVVIENSTPIPFSGSGSFLTVSSRRSIPSPSTCAFSFSIRSFSFLAASRSLAAFSTSASHFLNSSIFAAVAASWSIASLSAASSADLAAAASADAFLAAAAASSAAFLASASSLGQRLGGCRLGLRRARRLFAAPFISAAARHAPPRAESLLLLLDPLLFGGDEGRRHRWPP